MPSSSSDDLGRDSWLVSAGWLRQRLAAEPALVIDERPRAEYEAGHIPGAVHLPTFLRLIGGTDPRSLGAVRRQWAALYAAVGVTPDTTVVLYDKGLSNRAPRGLFILRYLGHPRAYVLHGGFPDWVEAGGPVARGRGEATHARGPAWRPAPRQEMVCSASELRSLLVDGAGVTVLDVRSEAEFRGWVRLQGNPRVGHLPGVAWTHWVDFLTDERRLRPRQELEAMLGELGVSRGRETIVYCQRSHRASNTYLVLRELGYPCRVYLGSMYEWTRLPDDFPLEVS